MSQVAYPAPSHEAMFTPETKATTMDIELDDQPRSLSPTPANAPKCWEEDEVLVMLRWLRPHKNRRRYANGLKANCCRELSEKILPNKRPKQIRNKLEYMIREYQRARQVMKAYARKRALRKAQGFSIDSATNPIPDPMEAARKACAFFDELHDIFGNDPEVVTDDELDMPLGSDEGLSSHISAARGGQGLSTGPVRRHASLSPSLGPIGRNQLFGQTDEAHDYASTGRSGHYGNPAHQRVAMSKSAFHTNGGNARTAGAPYLIPSSRSHHSPSNSSVTLPPIQSLDGRLNTTAPSKLGALYASKFHTVPRGQSTPPQSTTSSSDHPRYQQQQQNSGEARNTANWTTGTSPGTGLPDLATFASIAESLRPSSATATPTLSTRSYLATASSFVREGSVPIYRATPEPVRRTEASPGSTPALSSTVSAASSSAFSNRSCGLDTLASLTASPRSPTLLLAAQEQARSQKAATDLTPSYHSHPAKTFTSQEVDRLLHAQTLRMTDFMQEQQAKNQAFLQVLTRQQDQFMSQVLDTLKEFSREHTISAATVPSVSPLSRSTTPNPVPSASPLPRATTPIPVPSADASPRP
ncbi:hypothetical protein IWQ60_004489 [Tieghemiomyces parasiticus]|uniref:Uncharacterized protein n=1 Tax=Tieghemiomyces parasiticus TaxID=78921 RepID=A0A9W8A7Q8_9FUNG|nr:hypothetical protein IWQ60_004489 [Tieghemiomyces parasiticus]